MITNCQDVSEEAGDQRQKIASEIDSVLTDQYQLWYPRTVDNEYGGFLSRYSHDWQPVGPQDKMIVTQARHTWTASKVAYRDSSQKGFLKYGRHGFDFLRRTMWDDEHGGFYTTVSREGDVRTEDDGVIRKGLYGNAFGIYGLASYYQASGDTAALELAKKAFRWLDNGSHDKEYGGYFNSLTREGQPYDEGYAKDYNSGIHILEALAELYQVWPDDTVRDRLYEMFIVVRDRFTTDKGYMNLYFKQDWTPIIYKDSSRAVQQENLGTDHITFGHDIEAAFLLLEAAHALDFSEDSVLTQAKKMVDHTIENAWDGEEGGFYDRGYYFQGDQQLTVTDSSKVWWAEAEALHSLLIMAEHFPNDPNYDYFDLFAKQWDYIKTYLLDPQYGGWYESGLDEDPDMKEAPKATIWKGNYHTMRALLRCKELLKNIGH
ncbi:AGE family epimerase/isomerase [Aliifodinibius sp. S!AR15-10]|uniref:AGE family epimerase/isomerase n=1 Tax=Aliifodinibius sp. S!AR15-10 TaxID=2950437 RepID=UPI00285CF556|nr:AGE family epimerase/isomerase [Aliifodinibius sp. S!AR15-10]MDR8393568.1 AGE family epimerase/isomerase [Aliifodinibius sp. S!AR15-10]